MTTNRRVAAIHAELARLWADTLTERDHATKRFLDAIADVDTEQEEIHRLQYEVTRLSGSLEAYSKALDIAAKGAVS